MLININEETNLIRYCPQRTIDDKNGEFSENSFRLREKEDALSFDLAEFYNRKTLKENIECSIETLNKKLKIKNRINNFAVLYTKNIEAEDKNKKIIKIEREKSNSSHVLLYFNKIDEDEVSYLLAKIANERRLEIRKLFAK